MTDAETAAQLRRAVDQIPSMLAYWDLDLHCGFANQAYARWFGVDPTKLPGTSIRDLLGPELFALNEPYMRRALAGQQQIFERIIPGPDGIRRVALTTYTPHVQDGVVRGLITHGTEITQQKETEARLAETRQALSVALASIDAGYIMIDRDGHVSEMNAAAEQVTGWPSDEARGRILWDVFRRADRPSDYYHRNPVDVVIEQRITVEFAQHVVVVSRDGLRSTPLEVKAALMHNSDGSVRGFVMVFRDMGRVLRAEADARRLAAIVESSRDAIVGKTLDGRITSWNRGAEELFGWTAEEAIGEPILMLIPPERQHEEMAILGQLAEGHEIDAFETQRRAKDGSLREVSVSISPIRDASGRIVGASKIARDVTSQRRAEAALRASEAQQLAARETALRLEAENRRIQEASLLKSRFLANMSHELRTPLNAVIGFADLLRAGAVPADSPKHEEFLGHIAASGRHLLQLINDVLDLAKVESGRFEFYPEPIDLPQLVREAVAILQQQAQRKRIDVVIEADASLTDLQLDPGRLKQVLYNYLSNAIKFSGEGGHVHVRALPEGPAHVRIEVQDDGVGIAERDLPLLFTEFQQLDGGSSKAHQGTGLGLALTRRLVQAQGGHVGVRSRPGAGSVFHLVLNRVHGIDLAAAGVPPDARVLVIEDDGGVQAQVVRSLADAGFRVDGASSGAQALARAQAAVYDAIMLDLLLPDASGLDVLATIRDAGASRAAPVVGVSVPIEPGRAAGLAITDVLAKPLRTEEVAAAMAGLRRPDGARMRVMIIDDEANALELMRATLEAIDIDSILVQDPWRALHEAARQRPDAIVLDLMMPGLDGFTLLDGLRRTPEVAATPVFVWTCLTLSEDERARLVQSARAVMSKGGGLYENLVDALRLRAAVTPAS